MKYKMPSSEGRTGIITYISAVHGARNILGSHRKERQIPQYTAARNLFAYV